MFSKPINFARRVGRRVRREWRKFSGQWVCCNLCGWQGERLASDNWHPYTICPGCGSQVRHRLLMAAMTELPDLTFAKLTHNKTVLHFAPEDCLRPVLLSRAGRYVSADFLAEGYRYTIDLKLDLAHMPDVQTDSTDVVIACDVLEHIPNHIAAMREIYRVLRSGGWAVLTVPQKDNLPITFEDPTVVTPSDREHIFGQADHLRIYGDDFPNLLASVGFRVRQVSASDFAPELVRKHVLFPPVPSPHSLATNYRKVFFAHKPT